jgi:hypothetical protein
MSISFVCTSAFTYRKPSNGKIVAHPLGKKIAESTYRALPSGARRHFAEVASSRGYRRWSEDELMLLCELYLELPTHGDVDTIVAKFLQSFPDRAWGSVNSRAWGCVGLDAQRPEIGLGTWSTELVEMLHSVDAERFPRPVEQESRLDKKLDSLLASILA